MRGKTIESSVGVLGLVLLAWAGLPMVAFGLPEGRHYEMVSPPHKAGYGVTLIEGAGPNGDEIAYNSLGAFAGTPSNHIGFGVGPAYLARRGMLGWSTTPLEVPASIAPLSSSPADLSSNLEKAVFFSEFGPNDGSARQEGTEVGFLLHSTNTSSLTAGFEAAGGEVFTVPPGAEVKYSGGSADLSHIVLQAPQGVALTLGSAGLAAEAESEMLYDVMTGSNGTQAVRPIAINNQSQPEVIDPNCSTLSLGGQTFTPLTSIPGNGKQSTFDALAADGQEIFFETCAGSPASFQVFARLNGERTLEVSKPLEPCIGQGNHTPGEVPCEGAKERLPAAFSGASADGSKVFFLTKERLTSSDTDNSSDLYMATIACPSAEPGCEVDKREVTELVQASHDSGETAEVQGVVAVSPDGSRVYFVAHGVLSDSNREGHSPLAGADNLYVYDGSSQTVVFITDLCSNSIRSGEREDSSCPAQLAEGLANQNDAPLWESLEVEAQSFGDGRFLVFSSYGRLTADDTDNARDVYRYDAESDQLDRVSLGEAGYNANGNANDENGARSADAGIITTKVADSSRAFVQASLGERAISEDGSQIVFRSAEPLSPVATNGLMNAYEWHDGSISLVSTGSDAQPVGQKGQVVITPSGNGIFFTTVQELLPQQDTDDASDLYDARRGLDFPPGEAARRACSGDACQGPLTNPVPLLVPGSVSQAPGEHITPKTVAKKKVTSSIKKRKHGGKRKHRHDKRTSASRKRGRR